MILDMYNMDNSEIRKFCKFLIGEIEKGVDFSGVCELDKNNLDSSYTLRVDGYQHTIRGYWHTDYVDYVISCEECGYDNMVGLRDRLYKCTNCGGL